MDEVWETFHNNVKNFTKAGYDIKKRKCNIYECIFTSRDEQNIEKHIYVVNKMV